MSIENTLQPLEGTQKRPKHLWKKGCSGNPKGRPKGSRNKSTLATQLACQAILNNEAVALIRKALKMALDGDPKCLKLCLERILPPLKEPAEPKQIQHQIEVILRQPQWLTVGETIQDITPSEFNGKKFRDEQGQG
jgi:hypothetical protein